MNRCNLPAASNDPSGLIAWLEETRIALPLRSIDCGFDVRGDLAEVTLDQVFHQTTKCAVDVTYTFPLPSGAAVYRCELILKDRVIRARVEEWSKARTILREMKAAGHRAALVEMERENLFTLTLGNVQPNDLIVIRFAWFQLLDGPGGARSLSIPFAPGVRYIPGEPLLRANRGKGAVDDTDQVPDASRITPPRIGDLHPDAAFISIRGKIDGRFTSRELVSSSSHPIIIRESEEILEVTLSSDGHVPDRDFVIRWAEIEVASLDSKVLCCVDEGSCYVVARIDAPANAPVSVEQEHDYYFLVDRSGSMSGAKWLCTTAALQGFVRELGDGDRVWVTLFESTFQDFAEKPIPAREIEKDSAFVDLSLMETQGGTEFLAPVSHVLTKMALNSSKRSPVMVIITDGQVGNEASILSILGSHTDIPIHTFGIDNAVNEAFLKGIATQHQGTCALMTPNDDIQDAVSTLARRLRRPVFTGIAISDGWEAACDRVPNVYANDHILVTLKGPRSAKTLEIQGRMANGVSKRYSFDLNPTPVESPRLLWARQTIQKHLTNNMQADAFALAIKHNLVCLGTAFIAYDEKEKVNIAREELYQPSLQACTLEGIRSPRLTDSGTCEACIPGPSDAGQFPISNRTLRRLISTSLSPDNQKPDVSSLPPGYFISMAKKWESEVSKQPCFQSPIGLAILRILLNWVKEKPEERAVPLVAMECQFEPDQADVILRGFVHKYMDGPQAEELLNLITLMGIILTDKGTR